MHLIHSIGPKTQVLGRFGPFRYCTKVVVKLAELVPLSHEFVNKVASKFLMTNTHDPLQLTQNIDPKLMFWNVSDRFVTARKPMQNWLN
jgi:hypothetical protein